MTSIVREPSPVSEENEEVEMIEGVAGPSAPSKSPHSFEALTKLDIDAFDWTAYEGTYKDRALINHLMHISNLVPTSSTHPPPPQLVNFALTALRRALMHVKSSTWDTTLYLRILGQIDTLLHPVSGDGMDVERKGSGEEAGVPDTDWVEETLENERKEISRLDVELRGYMSNLIKESIRLTYLAFAQLALRCGSSQNAMKNYSAAREYSTSPQHHLDLGLGILNTCLSYNQPMNLPGHLTKIEASLDRLHPPPGSAHGGRVADAATMTAGEVRESRERQSKSGAGRRSVEVKVRVARGLVALASADYEKAGRQLAEVGEVGGLGDWEGVAMSTSDIATITVLCELATADRDRIHRVLLDRASLRASVDDNQGWILDLIHSFMGAQYDKVSDILRTVEPLLLLNPYLYPHVTALISAIHTRAIVQYVEPFSTIRISTMAGAFDMSEQAMLELLESLIGNGRINGRIDLIDKVLTLKSSEPRSTLYTNVLRMGRDTTASTRAALFRMKLHEAGITVDPRPTEAHNVGLGATDPMDGDELEEPLQVAA